MKIFGYDVRFSKQKSSPRNEAWSNDSMLWQSGNGIETASGRGAKSSAVEAAVSLIANDIATLEPKIYKENEDGTKTKVTNTPISRLLAKPNDYQTQVDFITQLIRDTFYYGNFYAWVDRDSRKQPRAIYPLKNGTVTPYIAETGDIYYGISLTELEAGTNKPVTPMMVPASEIFHHRVFATRHPLIGTSPLYAIGGSATLEAAIVGNMAKYHENASRPSGVLSIPGGLKQDARDRLRQEFAKAFSGDQSGKTMILDFDTKWQQTSFNGSDSNSVALLNYTVEDVCRALRIPKHMMGLEQGPATGTEQSMRMYYSHCLRPIIEGLENRFDDFFGFTGTDTEVEFDINELFRAETDKRVEALTKGIQGGVFSPNEARKQEGLAPVEGGDDVFLQRQMTSIALLKELNASELTASQPQQQEPQEIQEPEKSAEEIAAIIMKSAEPVVNVVESPEDIASAIMKELR